MALDSLSTTPLPSRTRSISQRPRESTNISNATPLPSRMKSVVQRVQETSDVSNAFIFWRSIRLLNLDQLSDCPKLDSTDEKEYVQSVEWSLYRLFELYDPRETKDKLNPFFPPLSPLQSRNLRSALFRCLSNLKKQGMLGPALLRKDMLDDCKGERFEETLAYFSFLVLKSKASDEDSSIPHTSFRLATASRLNPGDLAQFSPLIISHKKGLEILRRRREDLRLKFESMGEKLIAEQSNLVKESEAVEALYESNHVEHYPTKAEIEEIKSKVRKAWSTDQLGVEVILDGAAPNGSRDGELFSKMQATIEAQRERLGRWKAFHSSYIHENQVVRPSVISPETKISKTERFVLQPYLARGKILQQPQRFVDDDDYDVGNKSPVAAVQQYERLLHDMRRELRDNQISYSRPSPRIKEINRRVSIMEPEKVDKRDEIDPGNFKSKLQEQKKSDKDERRTLKTSKAKIETKPPSQSTSKSGQPDQQDLIKPAMPHKSPKAELSKVTASQTPNNDKSERSSTPTGDLFKDDVDYASVFKSRPKIKVSPQLSPGMRSLQNRRQSELGKGEDSDASDYQSSPLGRITR